MFESKESIDFLGSVVANINNILLTAIFIARIYKYPKIEYWLGLLFILSIIPLVLMFLKAFQFNRTGLYFIQMLLMIAFLIVEFILDYLLKIDFRHNRSMVIAYVTLFYASLGGMIGVAAQSGKRWAIITVITFILMTVTSLLMHFKTKS